MKKIAAADLFCGAGGTSTGLWQACQELGAKLELFAINHWNVAISTHSTNHPYAKHLCESIDNVDPRKLVRSGRLNLLVASPECTHHSNARGGRPMSDQSRASAWAILRWAEALYIDSIIVENVREFRDWGPLGADGRPMKSKRGQTFYSFICALRSLGYKVEDRIINCADYGDPTTRERLFIMARRGGKKIVWPEPTHGDDPLFGKLKPWRAAREIIDWSVEGQSIFNRKRPLAPATLARIEAGLRKFGGKNAEPFLVILRNHANAQSIDAPVPTVTAKGNHIGLCEPFVLGQQSGSVARSVGQPLPTIATDGAIALVEPFLVELRNGKTANSLDDPLSTVTTKGAHHGLCEPFVFAHQRRENQPTSVDEPLQTITASSSDFALVEPFIIAQFSEGAPRSVDKPLGTLTTTSRGVGLCEPFIVPFFGEREGQEPRTHSLDDPLPAVTSHGAGGLVEPFIMPVNHGKDDKRSYSMDRPMPTVTTIDAWGMVEPFLVKYNGTAKARPVSVPLDTVTSKDRFGLVETNQGPMKIDIRFRMLRPHELARAMSFGDDYKFSGNRELQVKQIGNAVPVRTARALCLAALR